jgi:SAM-dependent methyltransferase
MDKENSFDMYSDNYSKLVDKSISLSGEESSFFVKLKVSLLKSLMGKKHQDELKILDFGCGTGRFSKFIISDFPNSSYCGIDTSEKSIKVAKESYPHTNFLTMESLPQLEENKYDLVFAACVFHHIPQKEQNDILVAVKNSLKPGGLFVMFEHNPYNPLTLKVVNDCPFDKDAVLIKSNKAKSLFAKSGFSRNKVKYYFFFPKFLSFLRPLEKYFSKVPLGAQYLIEGYKK